MLPLIDINSLNQLLRCKLCRTIETNTSTSVHQGIMGDKTPEVVKHNSAGRERIINIIIIFNVIFGRKHHLIQKSKNC